MFSRRKKIYLKLAPRRKNSKVLYFKRKALANPFFKKKRAPIIKLPVLSFRVKLIILEIIVLVIGLIWFLFFSSVFIINNVIINGAQKISKTEVTTLLWQQTNRGLGLEKNIFLFNEGNFIKQLNEKYCLDDLSITESLPETIVITFKEKTNSAIWLENEKYYYIDNSANLIEQVDPLSIKGKNYPLIDNQGEALVVDKKVNISLEKIKFILTLFEKFKEKPYNFTIDRFVLENDDKTIKAAVLNGPAILFNTGEDQDKQFMKLDTIINDKLKTDFLKRNVIDLRYGDRVYYR